MSCRHTCNLQVPCTSVGLHARLHQLDPDECRVWYTLPQLKNELVRAHICAGTSTSAPGLAHLRRNCAGTRHTTWQSSAMTWCEDGGHFVLGWAGLGWAGCMGAWVHGCMGAWALGRDASVVIAQCSARLDHCAAYSGVLVGVQPIDRPTSSTCL